MTSTQIYGGRYELDGIIGDGGMARVYRARDTRLERVVAVKVLRDQFTSEPEFVARFRQEARLAAGLAHPNIVGVYDVGDEGGQYYIVMEYVPGENLKQIIARQAPIPLEAIIPFMRQLAAALDYAHSHGVIHRDIKPENILVTTKQEVKVGDFGIARALASGTLTSTGTVLGSVSYFSPEQASGQPATAESDLYSAGIVLYEMLTGRVPFSGPNPVAVAMAQVNDAPPSPLRFVPQLAPMVGEVVLKAIAKNPADRFHSGYELIAALSGAGQAAAMRLRVATASPVPGPATAPTMIAPPQALAAVPARRPSRPGRGGAGALAALLSTVALLIAAVLIFRGLSGNGSTATGQNATSTPTQIASTVVPAATKPEVSPGEGASPTVMAVVPVDTNTPIPAQSTATQATGVSAPPTETPAALDTPTTVTADTPTAGMETPTVTGTGTAPSGTATAKPGSAHGATIDLVTSRDMGPHFSAVGVTTLFPAGTSKVDAVAKIHDKAKGDAVVFTWHYPDGSSFPYKNVAVAPYKGTVTAYAELDPTGPGTYSVATSINGKVLNSVTFTISAGKATETTGSLGSATATPAVSGTTAGQ